MEIVRKAKALNYKAVKLNSIKFWCWIQATCLKSFAFHKNLNNIKKNVWISEFK